LNELNFTPRDSIGLCQLYTAVCSHTSECIYAQSPVHTGDKVEFNTVDFVESRPYCFGSVHTGNKVDRIGNKVERRPIGNKVDPSKLSNSRCCRFVAKTGDRVELSGNKVERIRQQSTLLPICCRFRQQSTFNKVERVEFNFVVIVCTGLYEKPHSCP